MSKLLPLNKFFIEQQINMNLSAILEEMPKYKLLVGIPGGEVNTSEKYFDFDASYRKAKKNAKRMKISSSKLLTGVFFELKRRMGQEVTDIAYYAAKNEFGSYSENTPARLFLRSTLEGESKKYIFDKAATILRKCAEENRGTKESLEKIGLFAAGEVQKNITKGKWKENSDVTKAIKGSEKPLMDTGTMMRSITSWVKLKKEKKE
jgi:hypothetical protein